MIMVILLYVTNQIAILVYTLIKYNLNSDVWDVD